MNETLRRVLTAFIVLPLVITSIFWGYQHSLAFFIIVLAASALMALELLSIVEIKRIRVYKVISVASVSLILLSVYLSSFRSDNIQTELILLILLLSTIILFLFETFQITFRLTLETIASHILVLVYCGVAMTYLLKLQRLSPYDLLYIWLITWMTDTGAYFSGKYLGKHKMNLRASPNKTLEGFIGGLTISLLSGVLLVLLLPNHYNPEQSSFYSWPILIPVTLLFSIIAIFGDLAESIMKRSGGVKDSKSYIPGHGGMLDVMDSLVYTVPLFYFLQILLKKS